MMDHIPHLRYHDGRSRRDRPGDHRQGLRQLAAAAGFRRAAAAGDRPSFRAEAAARDCLRAASDIPTMAEAAAGRLWPCCRPVRNRSRSVRPLSAGGRALCLSGRRTRGAAGAAGTDRRHRDRAAEQGGAEPRRLSLCRPHRHAGGADGHASSVMLLAHGDMRVGHVTTHVALADVPRLLTPERLRRTIELTHEALSDLGIAAPRIAVAALNPHAGEGGLFGRQDIEITTPVVEQCRADGLDVSGPVPGDTVFVKLRAAAVRRRGGDVSRPGAHPGEAAGLRCRSGDRDLAGAIRREHHARAAGDPHLGRSRHRVRHRRQGDRQRGKPDRGDRLRAAAGRGGGGRSAGRGADIHRGRRLLPSADDGAAACWCDTSQNKI